jgi:hypothetical protein
MTLNIPTEISAVILTAILGALGWLIIRLERMHTRIAVIETKLNFFDLVPKRTGMRVTAATAVAALLGLALLQGCGIGLRAHGGSMSHSAGQSHTRQPENPKDGAQQSTETAFELPLPAGSRVAIGTNLFCLAGDSVYKFVDKSESKIGGSQVDTVGAIVAKLKSARWLTILGALAFLAGLGAAFWPPARAVMGGTTPGFAVAGGGLVIAALPYVIIGNEKFLIVAGLVTALLTIAAIFLYRHGGHGRELAVLRKLTDKTTAEKTT